MLNAKQWGWAPPYRDGHDERGSLLESKIASVGPGGVVLKGVRLIQGPVYMSTDRNTADPLRYRNVGNTAEATGYRLAAVAP